MTLTLCFEHMNQRTSGNMFFIISQHILMPKNLMQGKKNPLFVSFIPTTTQPAHPAAVWQVAQKEALAAVLAEYRAASLLRLETP